MKGKGNGPIDACINALSDLLDSSIKISDYHQHAISSGSDASAAAYIEIQINEKALGYRNKFKYGGSFFRSYSQWYKQIYRLDSIEIIPFFYL